MLKHTLPLVALAALALPVAAGANRVNVVGPVALVGHGFVRADLESTQTSKPALFRIHAGYFRVVDLAGDLKGRCGGAVRSAKKQNAQGQTVLLCVGREGRLVLAGTHYRIFGFAMQYGARLPRGVSGTIQGRFRLCRPAAEGGRNCSGAKPSDDANAQPGDAADDLAALEDELNE